MVTSYSEILTRGYKSALLDTPIEDGKIRFATDTGELFVDVEDSRIQVTDFIFDYTESEILGLLTPLPKIYVASDTLKFYRYTDDWTECCATDYVKNASTAEYAKIATNADTSTYAINAGTSTYATNAGTATFATSATNASTATYATNAGTAINASTAEYAKIATNATSATNAGTATYATDAGNASSATNASTAEYAKSATSASTANSATNASTAEYAKSATSATSATNADTATYAINASTANFAKDATSATNAGSATYATNADTANYATTATKADQDGNGKQISTTYAPLNSPVLTGTPTAPTPASTSNDTTIATTEFVVNTIASGIGEKIGFGTQVVDVLPQTGIEATIYFVPKSDSENENIYDEYIWVNSSFEKIGSTNISLDGYYNAYEITGTGNAITTVTESGGKLSFAKNANFLTEHPSIESSSTTGSESPAAGTSFNTIDNISVDDNGHLLSYRSKTVTIPNSVDNASTANYAKTAGSATSATSATNAGTATYATNAGNATNATNASTANYAKTAGSATNAGTATYATNASTAKFSTNASSALYARLAGGIAEGANIDFGNLDG